jgi:phosphonatase-like hydrolase
VTIELVVFDMAGTTVHDGDSVLHAFQQALNHAGIQITRDEGNALMGIRKPFALRQIVTQKRGTVPLDEEVNRLHDIFLSEMLTYYRTHPEVREVDGATELFQELHAHGIKVGLDTGFSRPIADAILSRLGWDCPGLLDATVTSDQVAQGRPAPDMIFRLMELTGIRNVACVAKVGDTPVDLEQGTRAGCRLVVGVTEGTHTRDQLAACPHTHLISTIAELMPLI